MKHILWLIHNLRFALRRGAPKLLGVAAAFITLELLLRIWSVAYKDTYMSGDPGATDDFVVLTLGESTTAGVTADVWPEQLEKLLQEKYPARIVKVINKALPGTNTSVLVGNLESQIKSIRPDIIVSMMGINDTERMVTKSSAYIPNTKKDIFISQRFFRIAGRVTEGWLHRFYDLSISRDAEILNKKAEQYRLNGEFELSEKYFLRCITLEPNNAGHYVMLAIAYIDMQRLHEAEETLLRARVVDPTSEGVYTELGSYYRDNGRIDLAEKFFLKALTINPEYGLAYGAYATLLHWYKNDPGAAMGMYEKSIALYPGLLAPYLELADIYRNARRYDEALALYKNVLSRDPDNALAKREMINTKAAKSGGVAVGVSIFAGETIVNELPAITIENYRRMIGLASRYRIPVIAVQYPLASAEPLKKMVAEIAGMPGVTVEIADNQKNFQEALKNMKYNDLFTDYFGGNFGHTTREGSRLIAESVAAEVEKIIGVQTIAR